MSRSIITEPIEFLEKAFKAKEIVNEMTGIAQSSESYSLVSRIYNELDEIITPICGECDVKAKRFITSPAELYDPDMAQYPGGRNRSWDGSWYCPKCRHIVTYGERWWNNSSEETKNES